MRLNKDGELDPIKRRIQAAYPGVEISVLDNPRDYAASMLYLKNVPDDFRETFRKETDFVTIPLNSRNDNDYLVVPIEVKEADGVGSF